ncbi:MAG TPA: phosphoglucomutase [Clostridiales bacterium]|nr:phosphoglucomutase [Clostridiales bacterium]
MDYFEIYEKWLKNADKETVDEIKSIDANEIEDRFYKDLEFGTGGLRGLMGAGSNRMNKYTVRRATQGLADELSEGEKGESSVVIAYDSRNNSKEFATEAYKVLCGNGIKAYLFDSLRPTPELSFAVRYLNCKRGIVITASHNPKEYNGYKVYGEDGGQILPEKAERITEHINKLDMFSDIKIDNKPSIRFVGTEIDDAYISAVKQQAILVDVPEGFKVIYTPLHGSGNKPVTRILKEIGVNNLFIVPEQEAPDGNFPTVVSPNPENSEAFEIAIKYAIKQKADLILGTDPDSDRIGVAVRTNKDGEYKTLTGNQTGILLCNYILQSLPKEKYENSRLAIVKTIVTTEMVRSIANDFGVETVDVLTGFKYIGGKIKEFEKRGDREFVFGLEESYGYLKGTYARDKDAVVAAMLITELAAELWKQGKTLYDELEELFSKYGYYRESLYSLSLEGIEGMKKIQAIMDYFRSGSLNVGHTQKIDYLHDETGLPKSDVIKFFLEDAWFAVRPSGTEPKIKFYFGVCRKDEKDAEAALEELKKKVLNYNC